jgi:hypothetical protein
MAVFYKQLVVGAIGGLPYDVLHVVKGFCFVDVETAMDIGKKRHSEFITTLADHFNSGFVSRLTPISSVEDGPHWNANLTRSRFDRQSPRWMGGFYEEEKYFSAANCMMCGDYTESSSAFRLLKKYDLDASCEGESLWDAFDREKAMAFLLINHKIRCKCE